VAADGAWQHLAPAVYGRGNQPSAPLLLSAGPSAYAASNRRLSTEAYVNTYQRGHQLTTEAMPALIFDVPAGSRTRH
jgi:hypothetical protein